MKLRLKHGVKLDVKFDLAFALGQVQSWWEEENLGEFTITSLKDGQHKIGSQHRQDKPDEVPGEAADIRTRHHFDAQTQQHHPNIINFAKRLQQVGLRVMVHPDWEDTLVTPIRLPGIPGSGTKVSTAPHLHIGLRQDVVERVD